MSPAERSRWIEREDEMPLTMQCELAGVPRATVYRRLEAPEVLTLLSQGAALGTALRLHLDESERIDMVEMLAPEGLDCAQPAMKKHDTGHATTETA